MPLIEAGLEFSHAGCVFYISGMDEPIASLMVLYLGGVNVFSNSGHLCYVLRLRFPLRARPFERYQSVSILRAALQ